MSSLLFIVKKLQLDFETFQPHLFMISATPSLNSSKVSQICCNVEMTLCIYIILTRKISFLIVIIWCSSVLANVVNFASRVRCYFIAKTLFWHSVIFVVVFPWLSVTVAGFGREGKDGPVREFLSSRTPHTSPHPQVVIQSFPVKIAFFRELFMYSLNK